MSNARIRRRLEEMGAPVIAWLIDHGYVADDGGILNTTGTTYALGQGMLIAGRMLPAAPRPRGRQYLDMTPQNLRR